jgi:hypothetical protein
VEQETYTVVIDGPSGEPGSGDVDEAEDEVEEEEGGRFREANCLARSEPDANDPTTNTFL